MLTPVNHSSGAIRGFFIFSLSLFLMQGCTKIDTTDLGGDLIPVVDNVNTFADTLNVSSEQGFFISDSTQVSKTELHALGSITDDPLLGETRASVFLQLKPRFYPYYYGLPGDTINQQLMPGTGFDSVVLCLSFRGFWGDSTVPLSLQVVEVLPNNDLWDSVFQIRNVAYAPRTGALLGSKSVDVRNLRNVIKYANRRDSVSSQIRIRLTGLEPGLFQCDTSNNNFFRSDELFKTFNNGLGVIAQSGKGLVYVSLTDTSTKLEIHYRRKNKGPIDTTYSSFKLDFFGSLDTAGKFTVKPSSTSNNIVRNRPALPPGNTDLLLQAQPGTYAEIHIDSLNDYGNRIVHRASVIMQQIPDDIYYDSIFTIPALMYLDLKDTTAPARWKPVYFDLNPNTRYDPDYSSGLPFFPVSGVDFRYFGGFPRFNSDFSGRNTATYTFNVTRYLQQLVTKRTPNYRMRIFAPFDLSYPQYAPGDFPYGNRVAYGRVKVGGGAHPQKPMKLVVIYSKIRN